jgi:hypothetical protein
MCCRGVIEAVGAAAKRDRLLSIGAFAHRCRLSINALRLNEDASVPLTIRLTAVSVESDRDNGFGSSGAHWVR